MKTISPVTLKNVEIRDGFWSSRQKLMTDVTIPYMEKILRDEVPGAEKSHAISNFRMAAGEETGTFYGMVFQDSDVAKWLEAAAYSMAIKEDEALSRRVDDVVALIGRAQQEDGYLNTFFTVKEPEGKWTNLLECHELYCAGHMIEAAVALYEAASKRELLDICIRLADHIADRFMNEAGIPGHQEIELALLRLYHATGNERYCDMAVRFLDQRGQDPAWFEKNTPAHPDVRYGGYDLDPKDNVYNQSDLPVREQTTARGHAVRLVYMLTAMADAAATTGDETLCAACERMFDAVTQCQMYATGAVGSSAHHEAFSQDYDLPQDTCYGETCASVAMAFFAHNMLAMKPDGRYADLMELEIYNAALAGMQLDGQRFFYVNPQTVDPAVAGKAPGYEHVLVNRPQWHACACCPPNLARLITSLGGYILSTDEDTLYAHMMIGCSAKTALADLTIESAYPWQGYAAYKIHGRHAPYTLALHVPAHAKELCITVDGKAVKPRVARGYAYIDGPDAGSEVVMQFAMPVRRVYMDARVEATAGKAALARGPIVYCFEGVDNGEDILDRVLGKDVPVQALPYEENLLGGIVPLRAGDLHAIPYYAWSNRGANAMTVFLKEA